MRVLGEGGVTGELGSVVGRDDVVPAAVEEEGGAGHGLDAHLVIIALLRQPVAQEPGHLAGQRLDAGEGTDQHQRARTRLPHQLQRHPRPDRPPHHDHVLLLEPQPPHHVVVDVRAVLLDRLAARAALVQTVPHVLHREDVHLRREDVTWQRLRSRSSILQLSRMSSPEACRQKMRYLLPTIEFRNRQGMYFSISSSSMLEVASVIDSASSSSVPLASSSAASMVRCTSLVAEALQQFRKEARLLSLFSRLRMRGINMVSPQKSTSEYFTFGGVNRMKSRSIVICCDSMKYYKARVQLYPAATTPQDFGGRLGINKGRGLRIADQILFPSWQIFITYQQNDGGEGQEGADRGVHGVRACQRGRGAAGGPVRRDRVARARVRGVHPGGEVGEPLRQDLREDHRELQQGQLLQGHRAAHRREVYLHHQGDLRPPQPHQRPGARRGQDQRRQGLHLLQCRQVDDRHPGRQEVVRTRTAHCAHLRGGLQEGLQMIAPSRHTNNPPPLSPLPSLPLTQRPIFYPFCLVPREKCKVRTFLHFQFQKNQPAELVLPWEAKILANDYCEGSLLFYHNYKQQMDIKKVAIISAGALAVLFTGLYIKNVVSEKSIEQLSKEKVVRILRLIRKERYLVYKQIASFAVSIMQQMRGNINQQAIEQFLNGPECPFKYEEESEKIIAKVCENNNTTTDAFNLSLEKLSKEDPEIIQLLDQQQLDYKTSLGGKIPVYQVQVPSSLTKDKFYQLQNQLTKAIYMHQVRLFKILQKHSELEVQQNPAILKELGSPDAANEEMLQEEGLGSEFEPANAVYDAASLQFRTHPDFQRRVQSIESGYQKILMKYVQRIQTKTITDAELNQMEEEIIYFEPI